ADQADRPPAQHLAEDSRPPHTEQLSQDVRLIASGRNPVRSRARTGLQIAVSPYGEFPDFTVVASTRAPRLQWSWQVIDRSGCRVSPLPCSHSGRSYVVDPLVGRQPVSPSGSASDSRA